MNKICKVCAILVISALMTGCGSSIKFTGTTSIYDHEMNQTITQYGPGVQEAKMAMEARSLCQERIRKADTQKYETLKGMPPETLALVVMSENMRDMAVMMSGNYTDPCAPGTSVYDVAIAEIREKNKTARNLVPGVVKGIVGGVVGWKALDTLDNALAERGTSITGDGNTIDNKQFNMSGESNSVNIDSGTSMIPGVDDIIVEDIELEL